MRITAEGTSTVLYQMNISALQMTRRKIQGFKELERGWYYGEGIPIEQSSLDNALALNREAIHFGFLETDAFPGLNGEIMFTIYSDDHYLEFTLESDSNITFYREKGDEEVSYQERLSFQDAKEKIKQFRIEKWMESDSLTESITTTPDRVDLQALPSKTSELTPESPSLMQNVYSKVEEVFASISGYSINQLPMTHLSTGVSQQKYYLTVSG